MPVSDYSKAISLLGKGRANPSDYLVQLGPKASEFAASSDFNEYVQFFTRAATLPAVANTIMQVKGHEAVGISRNVITGRTFGSPAVFTFSDRSDLVVYTTLKDWIDSGVQRSAQREGVERNLRVQYYNSIKSDVQIYKLEPINAEGVFAPVPGNDTNQVTTRRNHLVTGVWTLYNAFPLSIEQTTLSLESADSMLDFNLSLAYESFNYQRLTPFTFNGLGQRLSLNGAQGV